MNAPTQQVNKYATFNRFEIEMTAEQVADCHHQGQCDADVEYWAPRIQRPAQCNPEVLRAELSEYGTWGETELSDDAANWRRIVWIAAGNIQDDEAQS